MSTSFNPNIPSNDDSVYDAYFSFFRNMESINNLLGVDHFNGTAAKYRGMHSKITFPEPSSVGRLTGSMGALFTAFDYTSDPFANSPFLQFANAKGSWEVLLDKKHYKFDRESTTFDIFAGEGIVQFPRGFVICWARGLAIKGTTATYDMPTTFERIYFANVFHCKSTSKLEFVQDDTSRSLNGLNWKVGTERFEVTNPFRNTDLNFQLLVLGVIPKKNL